MSFKKQFWNQKILSWEKDKYQERSKLWDFNSSVRHRLYLANIVIQQMADKMSLLELGCGSGKLWDKLCSSNLKSYKGVDFSDVAIQAFKKKIKGMSLKNRAAIKTSILCEDLTKHSYSADIVVSLGLLDWLSIDQIAQIAGNYGAKWYLHSFSEKRLSLSQMIHALYVFISYGHRAKSYVPQYYRADELLSIFGVHAKVYRDPKLSFGAFIYHLPGHVQFKT